MSNLPPPYDSGEILSAKEVAKISTQKQKELAKIDEQLRKEAQQLQDEQNNQCYNQYISKFGATLAGDFQKFIQCIKNNPIGSYIEHTILFDKQCLHRIESCHQYLTEFENKGYNFIYTKGKDLCFKYYISSDGPTIAINYSSYTIDEIYNCLIRQELDKQQEDELYAQYHKLYDQILIDAFVKFADKIKHNKNKKHEMKTILFDKRILTEISMIKNLIMDLETEYGVKRDLHYEISDNLLYNPDALTQKIHITYFAGIIQYILDHNEKYANYNACIMQ